MIKIWGIEIPNQITYTIIIIVISIIVYYLLKKVIDRFFNLKSNRFKIDMRKHRTSYGLFSNILKYIVIIFAFLSILNVFGINTTAIIASLGIIGLVVGLALQDTLRDILSGVFILIESQYSVGDIVEISGFKGEVISLGLKTTKIKGVTGEIKIVSNRNILEVINYSLNDSTLVIDFDVPSTYDTNEFEKELTEFLKVLSTKIKDIKSNYELLGIQGIGNMVTYRIKVVTSVSKKANIERETLKELKLFLDNNIKRK